MQKFFKFPFAVDGDRTAVANIADPSGLVTYEEGYGPDYQRPRTDPAKRNIERDRMNAILYDITAAMQELQSQGAPDFITPTLNGGTAYSYAINSLVRYNNENYYSLAGTNTALPTDTTKWALALFATDTVVDSIAALRLVPKDKYRMVLVSGYYVPGDGGGGPYVPKSSDTTSADNNSTTIVAADGGRYYLQHQGVLDVKQGGAKGDGSNADGPLLQGILDVCALQRIGRLNFSKGTYLTAQQLLIRQGAQTTSSAVGSDIHFMPDQNKLVIQSDAHATLKASAAITSVLRFSPTTVGGLGSYANFYSEIRGLLIDGNAFAGIGIYVDSAMHVTIDSNAITGVTTGIFNVGYGVHKVVRNVIRATVCANYSGGGDSMFLHNDFYINTGGTGILMTPFAGSTLILRNTNTPVDTTIADTNTKAVELRSDGVGDDVKALGAILIMGNRNDGVRWAVYGRGFSAANKNLHGIEICNNYIGAAGSSVTCDLVDFAFAEGLDIHDNQVTPGMSETAKVRSLGTLYACSNSSVQDNSIYGCTADGLLIDNACTDLVIDNNKFYDVGIGSTANAFVRIQGTSSGVVLRNNRFKQSSGTGAVNGIVEQGSANNNTADWNDMSGLITTEYAKVGAGTVFTSRLRRTAAPGTGTWLQGARNERPNPAASGFIGDVCVTGGTPGTWKTYGAISA